MKKVKLIFDVLGNGTDKGDGACQHVDQGRQKVKVDDQIERIGQNAEAERQDMGDGAYASKEKGEKRGDPIYAVTGPLGQKAQLAKKAEHERGKGQQKCALDGSIENGGHVRVHRKDHEQVRKDGRKAHIYIIGRKACFGLGKEKIQGADSR